SFNRRSKGRVTSTQRGVISLPVLVPIPLDLYRLFASAGSSADGDRQGRRRCVVVYIPPTATTDYCCCCWNSCWQLTLKSLAASPYRRLSPLLEPLLSQARVHVMRPCDEAFPVCRTAE
ncbi:unnamed protein product, partial [Ectocarpus fasciculatus]